MTFLQPFILFGLPLLLLPILIHLFNRLRHRSMPWAAMMFLRSATRKSTRYARLRQFLILLFRTLAVLGLILAVSRPLAGGWMGWMVGAAPDVILILLDRSASMEARDAAGAEETKREEAIELLAKSAAGFDRTSRIVLLDSVERRPQDIPVGAMAELPLTAASDTAADIPSMLQAAMDWFSQNRPGAGEIWIASDLQASNWDPESERWPALAGALAALPQGVRVRLLALNRTPAGNNSIRLESVAQRNLAGERELELVFEVRRSSTTSSTLPVTVVVGDARSVLDVDVAGGSVRYRHRVPLPEGAAGGWGYLELPADLNLTDNRSYFVYGNEPVLRAAVVGEEGLGVRILQFAAAPDSENTNQTCRVVSVAQAGSLPWGDLALVLWQAPLPVGEVARRVEQFVGDGGVVVFFPVAGELGSFGGVGWGELEPAPEDGAFKVAQWDKREGPLADSEEGLALPLDELTVIQRRAVVGEGTVLATYDDGMPFLARKTMGEGQVLFCSTVALRQWSGLADGGVLVPMLQRLFVEGGERFQRGLAVQCGDWTPSADDEPWVPVEGEYKDGRVQSGIYRSGAHFLAVNRPEREDDSLALAPEKAEALFGALPVQLFQEQGRGKAKMQSELWRLFLAGMALFLIVEAFLILPERRKEQAMPVAGVVEKSLGEGARAG